MAAPGTNPLQPFAFNHTKRRRNPSRIYILNATHSESATYRDGLCLSHLESITSTQNTPTGGRGYPSGEHHAKANLPPHQDQRTPLPLPAPRHPRPLLLPLPPPRAPGHHGPRPLAHRHRQCHLQTHHPTHRNRPPHPGRRRSHPGLHLPPRHRPRSQSHRAQTRGSHPLRPPTRQRQRQIRHHRTHRRQCHLQHRPKQRRRRLSHRKRRRGANKNKRDKRRNRPARRDKRRRNQSRSTSRSRNRATSRARNRPGDAEHGSHPQTQQRPTQRWSVAEPSHRSNP